VESRDGQILSQTSKRRGASEEQQRPDWYAGMAISVSKIEPRRRRSKLMLRPLCIGYAAGSPEMPEASHRIESLFFSILQ
jgi:hypothetical protein